MTDSVFANIPTSALMSLGLAGVRLARDPSSATVMENIACASALGTGSGNMFLPLLNAAQVMRSPNTGTIAEATSSTALSALIATRQTHLIPDAMRADSVATALNRYGVADLLIGDRSAAFSDLIDIPFAVYEIGASGMFPALYQGQDLTPTRISMLRGIVRGCGQCP
jgi:hypothetical protein